jgi:hypothetical protein
MHADPILPASLLSFYACKCIVHLHIGILWECSCIKVYPSMLSLLSPFVDYGTVSCAMLSSS